MYPEDPEPFAKFDKANTRSLDGFPKSNWLSMMIHFPYLDSDVLVVLDCYVEEVAGTASLENITFLLDDDNSWARYLVLFAGYTNPSARPSKLSEILVSLLGETMEAPSAITPQW